VWCSAELNKNHDWSMPQNRWFHGTSHRNAVAARIGRRHGEVSDSAALERPRTSSRYAALAIGRRPVCKARPRCRSEQAGPSTTASTATWSLSARSRARVQASGSLGSKTAPTTAPEGARAHLHLCRSIWASSCWMLPTRNIPKRPRTWTTPLCLSLGIPEVNAKRKLLGGTRGLGLDPVAVTFRFLRYLQLRPSSPAFRRRCG